MIRLAIVDHRPAMLAGLAAMLAPHPSVVVAGCASRPEEIEPLMHRTRPDAVLVDDGDDIDAIDLCRTIKEQPLAPKVLVLARTAQPTVVAAAILAEADAVLDRASGAAQLLEALHAVTADQRILPALSAGDLRVIAAIVRGEDHAILAMRLAETPSAEIAATLALDTAAMRQRAQRMIGALRGSAGALPQARSPAIGRTFVASSSLRASELCSTSMSRAKEDDL